MKKYRVNFSRFIPFVVCFLLVAFMFFKLCSTLIIKVNNKNKNTASKNDIEENSIIEQLDNTFSNVTTENQSNNTHVSRTVKLSNGEKSKNSLPVLMYHYFYDKSKGEKAKNGNWIEISKFEEQLKYLKDNDYYFPTWDEVSDFVEGKVDLPKKSVVITMDDGHKSLYKLAIPMLDKYKIPATAFIITKKFDTSNLEKYKNSTIIFESHTNDMHHGGGTYGHGGIFPALPLKESVTDLKTSIEKLGGSANVLAYPYGDCTERTKEAAEQSGMILAFTTVNKKLKPGMNKYELPRVRIDGKISLNGFKNSI